MVTALGVEEWRSDSRCAGWSNQDVIAHLAGVNMFWAASVRAGLAGSPTCLLANFDPIETPERLVADMRDLEAQAVLEAFTSGNDELLDLLGSLDDKGWGVLAETPPGHLPIRLLAGHALWDSWVHERDIALPLGIDQPVHLDEVGASLRYVCALVASLAILNGPDGAGSFAIAADNPEVRFVMDLSDCVTVRSASPDPQDAILRGNAVQLIEALSARTPFPTELPDEWVPLVAGFEAVFAPRD
jgi:uncharacterized protein (TIGR03083 family)